MDLLERLGLLGRRVLLLHHDDLGLTHAQFATVLLAALPSVFLWARLAGTLGSKGAWLLAIFLLALGALLLFLPRTLLEALPVGLLIGVGFGGVLVLGDILLAKVIDRDAEVTGRRREGVYYSVYGFINRLSPFRAPAGSFLCPPHPPLRLRERGGAGPASRGRLPLPYGGATLFGYALGPGPSLSLPLRSEG